MAEQAYYSVHPKFHAAVDCIIFGFEEGELSLLVHIFFILIIRFQPCKIRKKARNYNFLTYLSPCFLKGNRIFVFGKNYNNPK